MMKAFSQLSLAHRFLLTGLVVLVAGMVIVGTWVGHEIKIGVINRTGVVTSIYVDSFVSPHLQSFANDELLRDTDRVALDDLLSKTPLGRHIVAFKVWSPDGRILYSTNRAIVGRQFTIKPALASAFGGTVHSEIADITEPENEFEAKRWSRLIETYAPVHAENSERVVAVAEFYQTPDDLEREVRAAQLRSWLMVLLATLLMFVLLAGLVKRASRTIALQQSELSEKVTQLTGLLAQNEELHDRVRRAVRNYERKASSTVALTRSRPPDPLEELTERELEILKLVGEGLTNREIGQRVQLSEKTVKHYITNILQKLQVRNRVEAALIAAPNRQS